MIVLILKNGAKTARLSSYLCREVQGERGLVGGGERLQEPARADTTDREVLLSLEYVAR
jgi:hypothetical protein